MTKPPAIAARYAIYIIGFSAALYFSVYVLAWRSEGFRFLSERIRASSEVKERIGDVISVRPGLWGGYSENYTNDNRLLSIVVVARGSRGNAVINATAENRGGFWNLTDLKY